MNQADILAYLLRHNQDFIAKATDGLSHSESVLQLPGESNCMNWVLGHVAVYRDVMLSAISQPEYVTPSEVKLYNQNSKPITTSSKSTSLKQLLATLEKTYDALSDWLEKNPEGLQKETPPDIQISKGKTVSEHLAVLCWHESNHVGELHALRELALVSLGKGWK